MATSDTELRALAVRLRAFEGSDDLGNGNFTICTLAANALAYSVTRLAEQSREIERLRIIVAALSEEAKP